MISGKNITVFPGGDLIIINYMGFTDCNFWEKTAELLDKSCEMFGCKSFFNLIGVDKKKWIKQNDKSTIQPIYISPGSYLFPTVRKIK